MGGGRQKRAASLNRQKKNILDEQKKAVALAELKIIDEQKKAVNVARKKILDEQKKALDKPFDEPKKALDEPFDKLFVEPKKAEQIIIDYEIPKSLKMRSDMYSNFYEKLKKLSYTISLEDLKKLMFSLENTKFTSFELAKATTFTKPITFIEHAIFNTLQQGLMCNYYDDNNKENMEQYDYLSSLYHILVNTRTLNSLMN